MTIKTHMISSLIIILLASLAACQQSSSGESPETPKTAQEIHQEKLTRFMVKDDTLFRQVDIRQEGIAMYGDSASIASRTPEFFLHWDDARIFNSMMIQLSADSVISVLRRKGTEPFSASNTPALQTLPPRFWEKPTNKELPLQGVRIALDPGHMGGDMESAILEMKYVRMHEVPEKNIPEGLAFNEGNLSVATGILLKEKLEAAGAEVMLTRDELAHSSFGITFEEWMTTRFDTDLDSLADAKGYGDDFIDLYRHKATKKEVFHAIFKPIELRNRARKINAFRPDLTLMIHYNVQESNRPDPEHYIVPVSDNYNMTFVPGGFMKGELDTPEDRVHFLSILASDDLSSSISLSEHIGRGLAHHTNVPLLNEALDLRYLNKASIYAEADGVWARNLSLTRMVNGVLCFGESLYQDNEKECLELSKKTLDVAGISTSPRVQDVANGYYDGILNFVNEKRAQN